MGASRICRRTIADARAAARPGGDPARRRGGVVVHDAPDLEPARAADRPRRSQPHGLAAAAPHPERSQFPRPGHARHARQRRAVSADRVVRAVRANPRRSRERAQARSGGRRGPADAGAEPVPRTLAGAVLGRREPDLRARRQAATTRMREHKSGCRFRPARRRSVRPSRGCWSRTTKARSRRPGASRTSTRRSSARSTSFSARRSS